MSGLSSCGSRVAIRHEKNPIGRLTQTLTRITLPTSSYPLVLLEAEANERLSSLDRHLVRELYQGHGALLFRGFASDLDSFGRFAADFCPLAVHNEGANRAMLDPAQDIQSVSLGIQPFPLHPELSREPWKPDSAFFYCIQPPTTGGATTVCDGVAIVRELPPGLREQMAARRVKYIKLVQPSLLEYWLGQAHPDDAALANPPPHCPYGFERVDGRVVRIFTRPFLHRPMFIDELAFGNFLLFARYLRGSRTFPLLDDDTIVPDEWVRAVKQIGDRLTVPIGWEKGDLVMLDNTRFMHGRTAIVEGDHRLIATYFGYLHFANPSEEEPPNAIWRQPGFSPPGTRPHDG
jgi:alpha-ketoglutarate-dependent taurine dioxygenase